jgi:hypothetical protein
VGQDKKQKMLIAILAVAGLGAGSYYAFFRDSGSSQAPIVQNTAGRKERKKDDDSGKKEGRKERAEKAAPAPEPTGRKDRVEKPEEASGRKTRGKSNNEITKKKKIVPAA